MHGLGNRLRQRAAELGISDAEVARRAGLSPRRYSNYVNDEREPDYMTLLRICKALDLTPNQVLGVNGTAIRDEAAQDVTFVRELDIRAAAGLNGGLIEVMKGQEDGATTAIYGFPKEGFAQMFGTAPEGVVLIPVIGDSMQPTLFPGERVLVAVNDRSPSPPGIFVLWDGLGLVLKRVEYIPHSDPPTVRIISDNPRYQPYERTIEEAHILGRVIGKWGRM